MESTSPRTSSGNLSGAQPRTLSTDCCATEFMYRIIVRPSGLPLKLSPKDTGSKDKTAIPVELRSPKK